MHSTIVGMLCLLLLSGCAFTNPSNQWPERYHKDGATLQDLWGDGAACQPPRTSDLLAVSLFGLAGSLIAGGLVTATVNETHAAERHAACMQAKGYTVTQ